MSVGAILWNAFMTALLPQVLASIPAVFLQTERYFDTVGLLAFIKVTLASWAWGVDASFSLLKSFHWRKLALTSAILLWATRRTYLSKRIQFHNGRDSRFDDMRSSPLLFSIAWIGQAAWVFFALIPVVLVNAVPGLVLAAHASAPSSLDITALALYAGGLLLETIADRQLWRWMQRKAKGAEEGRWLMTGLRAFCRYPNYLGEIIVWTGIATFAVNSVALVPQARSALSLDILSALVLCYASPAFVTFLLKNITGVALTEKRQREKFGHLPEYQQWVARTGTLLPKF